MRKALLLPILLVMTLDMSPFAFGQQQIPFEKMKLVYFVETTYALKYRTGIAASGSITLLFHDVSSSSSKMDITVDGTVTQDSTQEPVKVSSTVDFPTNRDTLIYLRNAGQSSLTIYAGPSAVSFPEISDFTVDLTRTWTLEEKPNVSSKLSPSGSFSTYKYFASVKSVPAPGGGTVDLNFYAFYEALTQVLVYGEVYAIDKGSSAMIMKVELREVNLQFSGGRRCVIATAAYESELAPPVQFLREFRDRDVQRTYLGSAFISAFNAWYYPWATPVAEAEAQSGTLRDVFRIIVTPLVGALILSREASRLLPVNPEIAVLVTGLVASALIGMIYLGPFIFVAAHASENRINVPEHVQHTRQ